MGTVFDSKKDEFSHIFIFILAGGRHHIPINTDMMELQLFFMDFCNKISTADLIK